MKTVAVAFLLALTASPALAGRELLQAPTCTNPDPTACTTFGPEGAICHYVDFPGYTTTIEVAGPKVDIGVDTSAAICPVLPTGGYDCPADVLEGQKPELIAGIMAALAAAAADPNRETAPANCPVWTMNWIMCEPAPAEKGGLYFSCKTLPEAHNGDTVAACHVHTSAECPVVGGAVVCPPSALTGVLPAAHAADTLAVLSAMCPADVPAPANFSGTCAEPAIFGDYCGKWTGDSFECQLPQGSLECSTPSAAKVECDFAETFVCDIVDGKLQPDCLSALEVSDEVAATATAAFAAWCPGAEDLSACPPFPGTEGNWNGRYMELPATATTYGLSCRLGGAPESVAVCALLYPVASCPIVNGKPACAPGAFSAYPFLVAERTAYEVAAMCPNVPPPPSPKVPPPSPKVPPPPPACSVPNEGTGNVGCGNNGNDNIGDFNNGSNNVGSYNQGSNNQGDCNIGSNNIGNGWVGSGLGPGNGPNVDCRTAV